jgi:hypothetical protein
MGALARRVAALGTKLGSLADEVKGWRALLATDAFAMHTSQIEDVGGGLAAMQAQIEQAVAAAQAQGPLSGPDVERFERQILGALHIWECYRSKFALRLVESMRPTLSLLDDLAWHAYRPARDRAVATGAVDAVRVREPPLVFLNARWSPFARSREQAYELDEATGTTHMIAGFDRWLEKLPVPLVGIPWYQLAHLPDAVFIGHEVGHLVEDDLGLTEELRAAIDAALPDAPAERREAWKRRWRSEVFADVWGVLTTGSAYAAVLLDLLGLDGAGAAAEVQPDPRRPASPWSDYPTRLLRARLVCETVRQLPAAKPDEELFRQRAGELEKAGVTAPHAMSAYDDDVPRVVRALLTTSFPTLGKPLTDVLPFTAKMEHQARKDGAAANSSSAVAGGEIRTLFAGVARAFLADPAAFQAAEAQRRFRTRMLEVRTQGPRSVQAPGFVPAAPTDRHRHTAAAVLALIG